MEDFFTRYRNMAVLVAVVLVQIVMLGYQVRGDNDVRMLRVWAVSAVTPLEKALNTTFDFFGSGLSDYAWLVGTREENERLEKQLSEQKLENQQLHRLLDRFGREQEVQAFQSRFSSQTLMAEIIGVGSNPNAKEVFIDKGTDDGVQSGMGVITPDGIAGKVQAAYAASALVLLVNDASAGAGVLLENSRVRGVLKGSGSRQCRVDYVGNEVEVQVGEKVYTSGDDRIYPRGLPVGEVTGIGVGSAFQEIYVKPFAALDRLDEVLVIIAGVHQDLPSAPAAQPPQYLMPVPPPDEEGMSRNVPNTPPQPGDSPFPEARSSLANGLPPKPIAKTDADRLLERYRQIGAYQGHTYGEGNLESAPPNFNLGERRPLGGGPAAQGRMENYIPPVPIVEEPRTEAVPGAPEQP